MKSSELCHPTREKSRTKFCGANALKVCVTKRASMKYKCDACNSVAASADCLCSPSPID